MSSKAHEFGVISGGWDQTCIGLHNVDFLDPDMFICAFVFTNALYICIYQYAENFANGQQPLYWGKPLKFVWHYLIVYIWYSGLFVLLENRALELQPMDLLVCGKIWCLCWSLFTFRGVFLCFIFNGSGARFWEVKTFFENAQR